MRTTRLVFMLVATVALTTLGYEAQAEQRTALVIGNGAYKATPLKNPTNDAQDMANTLREMGFDVTLKLNATHRDMEEAVRVFGAKLKQGGLGLFYYAGHGVQVGGENYLLPVNTKIDAEADVKFGALNAGMVLAKMEDAGNGLNIVILDACRTNPFARSFRTAEQGLARMDAPKGSLIAYATAPGRVAADGGGNGRNGIFTGFLLHHIRTPGLKVEEALKLVRADVVRATADKQVPWESSSLIGDFYFVLPQEQTTNENVASSSVAASTPLFSKATLPKSPAPQNKPSSEADELFKMGYLAYQEGDLAEAAKWYRKAADLGDAMSQSFLGRMYSKGEGVPQDNAEAALLLRKAADQGFAHAYASLGLMYLAGRGVHLDYAEAMRLFRKAADLGFAAAQYALGTMYTQGLGVPQNHSEASKWYRKAAAQGHIESQMVLGAMHEKGLGVPKSDAEAAKWYNKAADLGDAKAQLLLGMMYAKGEGVRQNYPEAIKWYRKAADQGFAAAQFILGMMYAQGQQGVLKNYVEAMKWYRKAAEQGHTLAQFNLGLMYSSGQGVLPSYNEAMPWYRKSAEQGYALAQAVVAANYYLGRGVKKDVVEAYSWCLLAIEQGDQTAASIQSLLVSMMTSAQIDEAKYLASKFKQNMRQ